MERTIELTDVVESSGITARLRRWLVWLCFRAALLGLIALGLRYGSAQAFEYCERNYYQLKSDIEARLTKIAVVKEYISASSVSLDEAIDRASKEYSVPPLLLHALVIQESGEKPRADRVRFEAHLLPKFKREKYMTQAEHEALASSWGYAQVIYGLHRERCALKSYAELLEPQKNLLCSAKILHECLTRRARVVSKKERFTQCLNEYNGDQTGQYAESVLNHLGEIVLEGTL